VYVAPLDVVLADDSVLQPDVVVARQGDVTEHDLSAPVLAVEVLSPSTGKIDQLLKPARYAASGIEHYWVVDPDQPSVTVWELRDGVYVLVGDAAGQEVLELIAPYGVRLVPADLVADV